MNPEAVDGYKVVKIREPASKRRKKTGQKLEMGQPPTTAAEAANPIPLNTIQEWALACGVSPSEVTEDALLEGHDADED